MKIACLMGSNEENDSRGTLPCSAKLKKFTILEFPQQVVFEVADVVATAAKMGIKVESLDKVLGETAAKRDHFPLLQEVKKLRKRIEELQHEKEEAK